MEATEVVLFCIMGLTTEAAVAVPLHPIVRMVHLTRVAAVALLLPQAAATAVWVQPLPKQNQVLRIQVAVEVVEKRRQMDTQERRVVRA